MRLLATEQPTFTFAFAHRLKESAATTPPGESH
jgi:hypothetical protein